jgi:hypothetical protein
MKKSKMRGDSEGKTNQRKKERKKDRQTERQTARTNEEKKGTDRRQNADPDILVAIQN